MENYVVTISREFGSLGRSIAKRLSELLEIEFYDRDVVELASEELKLPVSIISDAEESANTFFHRKYPLGMGTNTLQDAIFTAQKQIISTMAEKHSCIIVGRCGNYVFQNHPRSFHVYIYANEKDKLKNCVEKLKMDIKEAKRTMLQVDNARNAYYETYANTRLDNKENYHLMIDSGKLGVEETAQILASAIKRKFCL